MRNFKIMGVTWLFIVLVGLIVMISNNKISKLHNCSIPDDIPKKLVTGERVDWDCNWQSSYNAGRVKVVRNDKGEATMIYRSR